MNLLSTIGRWFGFSGAIGERPGKQNASPSNSPVPDSADIGVDGALQLSTVWAAIDRRATLLASLPLFVYKVDTAGMRTLARGTRFYNLLHESPNSRMTSFEFWRGIVMNHDLRGNAYARIERDSDGEAIAMWPMPADQVSSSVLPDGTMVYEYRFGNDVAILSAENVLHIKNLGNGTTGLAKLDFMRATTTEATRAQTAASKLFGSGGKPTGVLMIDSILNPEQRDKVKKQFSELAEGSTSRLIVLEANMKYQQISMSPEDLQLLKTREFTVEELCRWLDVPPVLVHHSNVTAWGTGIFEIKDGFYTLALTPLCINIEQAIRKRVMTPRQRASMSVEFSIDAMMRASIKDRYDIYAKATQNGLKTRNETRQLENDPPMPGGEVLTVQSNMIPITMMGKVAPRSASVDTIAQ
jgi:HK97 family phage portal protein